MACQVERDDQGREEVVDILTTRDAQASSSASSSMRGWRDEKPPPSSSKGPPLRVLPLMVRDCARRTLMYGRPRFEFFIMWLLADVVMLASRAFRAAAGATVEEGGESGSSSGEAGGGLVRCCLSGRPLASSSGS